MTRHALACVQDKRYLGRTRIGSFSAASNVTGIKTDVHAIAVLLHQHNALACFDYAAAGPYVGIDMNPKGIPGAHIDAICLSMHKASCRSSHRCHLLIYAQGKLQELT